MKVLNKLPAIALMLAVSPALADNTDSAAVGVEGTVIAALEVETVENLTMPHIVNVGADADLSTPTVTLTCNNLGEEEVVWSAGANPYAHGTATATTASADSWNNGAAPYTGVLGNPVGACATLSVTGEENYYYKYSTAISTATDGEVEMTGVNCRNASRNSTNTGRLFSGDDQIYCGGTVQLNGPAEGDYSNIAFNVTVTYD